jgi:hypothetical protein
MQKERQLVSIRIAPDLSSVKVKFKEIVTLELEEGQEDNQRSVRQYSTTSIDRPHPDLVESLTKLRRHGLKILNLELKDEARTIKQWCVLAVKIDGDMVMEQARIQMTLGLKVESTGKVSDLKVPQIAMWPKEGEGTYHDVAKMTSIVEDLVEEVWSYLFEGKFETEVNGQLALFPNHREALSAEHFINKLEKEKERGLMKA